MKTRSIIIIVAVAIVAIAAATTVYLRQITYTSYLELHTNVFMFSAFTDNGQEIDAPFEVMLYDYSLDSSDVYKTELFLYLQPPYNQLPENITEISLRAEVQYDYQGYTIFLEQFHYEPMEDRLYATLVIRQRKWQQLIINN